jgi:hypothetical protein
LAGVGTNTASLVFGGLTPSVTAITESYNGSNWTEVADLNTARDMLGGGGTNTSALAFGGLTPPSTRLAVTESWNGSAWTEVNDLNTARYQVAGSGESNTSALAFGGNKPPNNATGETEQWNGSSWTELADLSQVGATQGTGTVTSSIAVGREPSPSAATEEWSNTSFTTKTVSTD